MQVRKPGFDAELLDRLLAGRDPQTVLESEGLMGELKAALAERLLNAEMDVHLSREAEQTAGNHRNGTSAKTVLTSEGELTLSIPRDRQGRFDPLLIGKYRRRFPGFDTKLIAMYARGMSTREIQAQIRELYGVEISPELVSAVTEAVLDEVKDWQSRPLEDTYAFVFFDALRVKIRDEGLVRTKSVYLALGMRTDGSKEILGLWIEQTEGAKFWLRVMNELAARGLKDILIAIVDGLKGFPEAITSVFPHTVVQTCIVHLLRYSLQFASWKERKAIVAALKPIYQAADAEAARAALEAFDQGPWGRKYPAIAQSWRRKWDEVIPFFAFSLPIRRIVYTTNAIESLNSTVRRAIRNKGHFPSDEAATKLIWLALQQAAKKWKNPPACWHAAKAELAILFEDRFVLSN
ncbi:MAG: IS256 family transposase [Gammaproteobacteria bacterium]